MTKPSRPVVGNTKLVELYWVLSDNKTSPQYFAVRAKTDRRNKFRQENFKRERQKEIIEYSITPYDYIMSEYNITPYCFIPYIVLSTLINDIYTILNITIYLNYFPLKYITLFIKLKLKLFKLNMHLSYLVKSSEALLHVTSFVSLKKGTRCNIICQFVKSKCHFIISFCLSLAPCLCLNCRYNLNPVNKLFEVMSSCAVKLQA